MVESHAFYLYPVSYIQYMSEKVLKAEHTRKDEEYREMEKVRALDIMTLLDVDFYGKLPRSVEVQFCG